MDRQKQEKPKTNPSEKQVVENSSGEIRTDYRTGLKSILAMSRKDRPVDYKSKETVEAGPKDKCPFEPERDGLNKTYIEIGSPWGVRVIYNKYPLLDCNSEASSEKNGFLTKSTNFGYSFVVIDTRDHDRKFEDASKTELIELAEALVRTENGIFEDKRINFVYLNKNFGRASSGTLSHSHWQVLGYADLPMLISERARISSEYMKKTGRCLIEDAIKFEKERHISDEAYTLSYSPFAPLYTGESIIVPKRHAGSLGELYEYEWLEMLRQSQAIIKANNSIFGSHAYNILGYSLRGVGHFHSYIEIIPRVGHIGPMQMAGYYGSTIMPEKYSEMVRDFLM
ncbi:MAG: hypothetical protein M1544_01425 [Candidatus Marsarchaeota archaeon]|nr:hypothetical protein [Candidatus Marsarchaeota archaeon]MCL5101998.1 hypothetical protein [Candidatus Marsarchaeota archaeon]